MGLMGFRGVLGSTGWGVRAAAGVSWGDVGGPTVLCFFAHMALARSPKALRAASCFSEGGFLVGVASGSAIHPHPFTHRPFLH